MTNAAAVFGNSNSGTGVYCQSNSNGGVFAISNSNEGVRGESRSGRGGMFAGPKAQVKLLPATAATHPALGEAGDIFLGFASSARLSASHSLGCFPAGHPRPTDILRRMLREGGDFLVLDATRRRRHGVWVVLLCAALVVGCSTAAAPTPAASPSATETPTPTDPSGATGPSDSAYGRLFAKVEAEGSVSLETALEAFSLAIEPLPGVEIPQGSEPVRDYERADGTFAVNWILRHYDELSSDQKAIVEQALDTPGEPVARLAATGQLAVVAAHLPILVADETQPYLDALNAAEELIAAHLGRNLGSGWSFSLDDEPDPDDPYALAYAAPPLLARRWCSIHATPRLRASTEIGELKSTMAHEMFHCFQFDIVGSSGDVPDWILEGQAEWAGEDVGGATGIGANWFREYIEHPTRSVYARTYDAVGFYEHLHEVGTTEPWGIFDAMLGADGNDAAFVASSAASDAFLDTWPSGFFRDQSLGDAWFAQARWGHPGKGSPNEISIGVGRPAQFTIDDPSAIMLSVVSSAEITQVHIQGHARMQEAGHNDRIGLQQVDLCTSPQGCECRSGWTYRGPPLEPSSGTFNIAVTGGLIGAAGSIEGHALDEFCFPDHLPLGGACPGGCARDTGDPHMTTVDGRAYEFQSAGEFVVLRSADGVLEIQGRQEPSSQSELVTINTALAMRIAGRRLTFDVGTPDGEPLIRLDGEALSNDASANLGPGADLVPEPGAWRVGFPDGTIALVRADQLYGVTLLVNPSESLLATGVGILASVADNSRLPRLPDGTALPEPTTDHDRFTQTYETFADAWRVTDQTTLFDYDAGTSTADYQLFGYPTEEDLTAIELQLAEGNEAAEAACAAVLDPDLHRECVYDVSVTGEVTYADEYAAIATLLDAAPSPTASPIATPSDIEYPAGFVELAHDVAGLNGAALAPDATLYLFVNGGLNGFGVAAVDPIDGAILRAAETTRGYGGRIAFANGWLWLGDAVDVGDTGCSLSRFDPAALEELESIPTLCPFFNTAIAGTDEGVWYYDEEADGGAVVRLLADSATQEVRHVALPSAGGRLTSSSGTLFYSDSGGTYRLLPDATAFEAVASAASPDVPVGPGFWTAEDGTAAYYEAGATPLRTVAIEGDLVGADGDAVYASRLALNGEAAALWRYPIDGSQATQIAEGATMAVGGDGWTLGYSPTDAGGHPPLIGPDSVVKLWTLYSPVDAYWNPLVMQFTALPAP